MSIVSDITGSLFGGDDAADAAGDAASLQARAAEEAIEFQRESLETIRGDLAPFRTAGRKALQRLVDGQGREQAPSLQRLIRRPEEQRKFIEDNPFFESLANQAQSRLFANQAARGKVGSGGTAEALQNSLLLLGTDLVNQNITQRMNLATLGANAAAQTGTITQGATANITDLTTQRGNVLAAGQIGAANAQTSAMNTGINTALGIGSLLMLSDIRYKTNIRPLCKINGHNTYIFKYRGSDDYQVGVMAQEVEMVNPGAIVEVGGVKLVNYGAL
jgi:hypothetical protein